MRFLNDFVERQTQHMLDFIARISVSPTSRLAPALSNGTAFQVTPQVVIPEE